MRSGLLGGIAALLIATSAAGVEVSVRFEPPVVPFHKEAYLTLEAIAPADVPVHFPDMRGKTGDLEVAGTPGLVREPLPDGRVRTTETYMLEPVFVKDYLFDPVEVTWGEDGRATIQPPLFRVRELTEAERIEAETFEQALPGIPPGTGPGSRALYIAGAVILALAAAAAYWRYRAMQTAGPAPPAPRIPWEVARERLNSLAARNLPESGKAGTFYVDLSSILRYYIEDRFDLHAPERSTPELLAEAADRGVFPPEQQRFLERLLRLCDRVKFAQYAPMLETMHESFDEVAAFVEETVPRIDADETAEAA